MRVIIKENYENICYWVASYIKNKIMQQIDGKIILGLPTGSTPIGVYRNLINFYRNNELTFKHVITFNMDEYVGLDKTHPQSYHYFMHENFFKHIDIVPSNIHILNGCAKNLEQECADYETAIAQNGGIDLMLGGIGTDGHIAFNEPGSSLNSITRIKTLNNETIESNSRFFTNVSDVPKMALTIGIRTIMNSKEVIIIASGTNKALAIKGSIEDPISHMCPASILQNHEKACFVIDDASTDELRVRTVNYFKGLQTSIDYQGKPILKNLNNHIHEQSKILIFSPHPDDDVIGMAGTIYINQHKKNPPNISVCYMTSGENGIPKEFNDQSCREQEAINSIQTLGLERKSASFIKLPFYQHKKKFSKLSIEYNFEQDIKICSNVITVKNPTDIFICSDNDPNGTHETCFNILQKTLKQSKFLDRNINIWLYKGAWGHINNSDAISMPIPKSIMDIKLISIKQHLSQFPAKFPGNDSRSFDERVLDYNQSNIMFGEFEEKFEKLNIHNFVSYNF